MSPPLALLVFLAALLGLGRLARTRSAAVKLTRPVVVILALCAALAIVRADHRGTPIALTVTLACVVVCAASDLATGLVFDSVAATTAIAILLASILSRDMLVAAIGACSCAGVMLLLYTVTRGRGIGLGDVKLGAVIGAGLGGVASVGALGAAFIAGAVWAIPLLVFRRVQRGDRVAFAPFLAVGAIASTALRWVTGHG
jgi:prepilin signal peptidase PulO-like enzyme (type II secretory pathway)